MCLSPPRFGEHSRGLVGPWPSSPPGVPQVKETCISWDKRVHRGNTYSMYTQNAIKEVRSLAFELCVSGPGGLGGLGNEKAIEAAQQSQAWTAGPSQFWNPSSCRGRFRRRWPRRGGPRRPSASQQTAERRGVFVRKPCRRSPSLTCPYPNTSECPSTSRSTS